MPFTRAPTSRPMTRLRRAYFSCHAGVTETSHWAFWPPRRTHTDGRRHNKQDSGRTCVTRRPAAFGRQLGWFCKPYGGFHRIEHCSYRSGREPSRSATGLIARLSAASWVARPAISGAWAMIAGIHASAGQPERGHRAESHNFRPIFGGSRAVFGVKGASDGPGLGDGDFCRREGRDAAANGAWRRLCFSQYAVTWVDGNTGGCLAPPAGPD